MFSKTLLHWFMMLMVTLGLTAHGKAGELKPAGELEGYVSSATGTVYTSGATGYVLAGNNNPLLFSYNGVIKFKITAPVTNDPNILTEPVAAAKLQLWCIYSSSGTSGYGGVYVQLQHYTYDNGTALAHIDATTASVENVGPVVFIPGSISQNTLYEWDVAESLDMDRLYSKNYSSYRLRAVDPEGNPININGYGAFFQSQDYAPGTPGIPAFNNLYPRIVFELGLRPRTIKPTTDMEGFASAAGVITTNAYLLAGNNNANLFGYRGVLKFSLAGVIDEVSGATLNLWKSNVSDNNGDGGVYVQLQHYTFDNAGALAVSDASTANVENVGSPRLMLGYPNEAFFTLKQWDVSPYVEADRAAGFANSSFRIIATDSAGNPINVPNHGAYFCTQDTWTSGAYPADPTLFPRLQLTYEAPSELKPQTAMEGYVSTATGGVNTTSYLMAGNNNDNLFGYKAVVKFALDDVIPVKKATLQIGRIRAFAGYTGYAGTYVQLQHYTFHNAETLNAADAATDDVENVGEVILMKEYPDGGLNVLCEWDVTDYVEADRIAGFEYSSFRLQATDPNGVFLNAPSYGVYFQSQDYLTGTSAIPADTSQYPRIQMTYFPTTCSHVWDQGDGLTADISRDCYVNISDLAALAGAWLDCTAPGQENCTFVAFNPTGTIVRGTATVDGNLDEWADADEWVYLNDVYYGNPSDVTEAKMSLRWDGDNEVIYAAVMVTDTVHMFSDAYGDWDDSDRLEVFSQGDAAGGTDYGATCEIAQQYFVAPNTSAGAWASWPNGYALTGNPDPGFVYAVRVNGDQIIYELAVKQYDNYAGRLGALGDTLVTELETGDMIRFDIVVDTRWGTGADDFGMLAAYNYGPKYYNANTFALYQLVEQTPCGGWGFSNADLNQDCITNLADLCLLAQQWIQCNNPGDESCAGN